jgi:hypothetical protein
MKKAPIALGLVLVFGLFAAAFSLGPAIAQDYDPNNPNSLGTPSNTTSTAGTSNVTGTDNQTSTAAEGSTFSASGRIAALIYDTAEDNETETTSDTSSNMSSSNTTSFGSTEPSNTTLTQTITGANDTMTAGNTTFGNVTGADNATSGMNDTATAAEEEEVELPYIVSGDWSLEVQDGNVTDFAANFTMVHTDGTGRHTHDVSNFEASNSSAQLVQDGVTFIFGTSDIMTNGSSGWTGVDTLIVIENANAVSLTFSTDDDHFKGQPLYGIVDSLTDENGNELIETTETAQEGNATGVGGLVDDAANQTGGFLGNLSDSLQNMTGLGQ